MNSETITEKLMEIIRSDFDCQSEEANCLLEMAEELKYEERLEMWAVLLYCFGRYPRDNGAKKGRKMSHERFEMLNNRLGTEVKRKVLDAMERRPGLSSLAQEIDTFLSTYRGDEKTYVLTHLLQSPLTPYTELPENRVRLSKMKKSRICADMKVDISRVDDLINAPLADDVEVASSILDIINGQDDREHSAMLMVVTLLLVQRAATRKAIKKVIEKISELDEE